MVRYLFGIPILMGLVSTGLCIVLLRRRIRWAVTSSDMVRGGYRSTSPSD
jgi:hypothetical protein